MGISGGPKLPTNNLLATYQPGDPGYLDASTTASFANDVATPFQGAVIGPRRTYNAGFGPAYDDLYSSNIAEGPVMEIQNISGSIYTVNTTTTTVYTVSTWIKVVSFPAKYENTPAIGRGTNSTKSKRALLARFNYSSGATTQRGWIEFGAMAPYYLNSSNVPNYKSIFSPISFGAAIVGFSRAYSVYTDYKFNLNQWYLLTIQLESSSNFSVLTNQTVTAKMFVNNTQENIAQFQGIAWRQKHTGKPPRRQSGMVAAQPGFLNRDTGGTVSNASSQSFMFKLFPDLTNLNYISYSPLKAFNTTSNYNNGSNTPNIANTVHSGLYMQGSGINFGQTYIYNTAFNSNIYTQFKPTYS